MRFLIDANIRLSVSVFLKAEGHDVRVLAGTSDHDLSDKEVLSLAVSEKRVILTNDKDFGTLIFFQRRKHSGVVLFRLTDESEEHYRKRLGHTLDHFGSRLERHFLVITDFHIRFR